MSEEGAIFRLGDEIHIKTLEGFMTDIKDTLQERREKYGEFSVNSKIMQDIKDVMVASPNWKELPAYQKESLEMIAHKMGRILGGDPNHIDSWHDIAGYATLCEVELGKVVPLDQSRVEIDGGGITLYYDDNGNKTKEVHPDGRTYTYEYDSKGNRTKEVNPDGETLTWEYDSKGNRTKRVHPDGRTFTWEYDSKGNRTKRVNPDGGTFTYEYDSKGNMTRVESRKET